MSLSRGCWKHWLAYDMPAGPGGTERGSYVLDAGRGTGSQSLIWSSPDNPNPHFWNCTVRLEKQGRPCLHIGDGVTRRARPEGHPQVPSRHPPPNGNSSSTRMEADVYLKNCRRGGDTGIIAPLFPPPYMWFARECYAQRLLWK
jgi:hypothetical protein